MSNYVSKLLKKGRRKFRGKRAVKSDHSQIDYKERLSRHRRRQLLRAGSIIAVIAIIAALVYLYLDKKTYRNFRILSTSEQEDVVSTGYQEMDGFILRYSPDEVSLENKSLESQWSNSHSMQNPMADVRGEYAVVADKDGTSMEIYNKKGLIGTASTSYAIVKATVSEDGLVAAILDSGEDTYINFYAADGSLIAENQTKIDDPGFPLDLAISNNGVILMVTYQFVDGGETTSYVAFYNFGDVGQNEDDRIVSGYTYDGIVIPQVEYLGGSTCVAIREDGFALYSGSQIPKEKRIEHVDEEIVSTFYDDHIVGMVFKNTEKDKMYSMQVYTSSGNLKFKKDFNIPYTNIRMSDGSILMYNSNQICVMNDDGVMKYSGSVDGTVKDFFKIGWNRYMLVLDSGVNIIKFT